MGDYKHRWVILARARVNRRSLRPYISTPFYVLMDANGPLQCHLDHYSVHRYQWTPMDTFNAPVDAFSTPMDTFNASMDAF